MRSCTSSTFPRLLRQKAYWSPSVSQTEDPDFRGHISAPRYPEVKSIEWTREDGSRSVSHGGHTCSAPVVIGILLFDDVNKSRAAGDIDLAADGIIEKIVGNAVNLDFRHQLSGESIQDQQLSGLARAHEQTMVFFIELDWSVPLETIQRPWVKIHKPFAMQHCHFIQAGHVGKDSTSF